MIFRREAEIELEFKKELLDIVIEKEKDNQARAEAILSQKIDLENDIKRLEKDLERDNG